MSSDPAYIASGISGVCLECHVPHQAFELRLWGRDLAPDAVNASDLCLDCHSGAPPSWATFAKDVSDVEISLHDFSSAPIGSDGVCSSCHDLHYPDETTASYAGSSSGHYFTGYVLWKRDLTNDLAQYYQKRDLATDSDPVGGPNYLVGNTVFCYDCHGGDARRDGPDDSHFNPDPQDIAFGRDRDVAGGNVGYYELPTGEQPDAGTQAPSMNSIITSPDDPDNVAGGHYVQSSMNNDGSSVNDNYEARDPDGNLLYKISVGDKLPCELCHDPHIKESTLSSSPPDEVFFRRDIYTGEGVVVNRSSESYFSAKIEASEFTRNGAGGVGDGRRMCQYCHGTGDWDESQNPGPTGGIAPLVVDWTSRTTIYGIQIRTASTPGGSTAFPPPNLVYHAKDDNQPACASCHIHNNVKSANCGACHNYPPTTGAHGKHALTQAAGGLEISCDVCHGLGAEQSDNFGHAEGGETVLSANITLLGNAGYGTTKPSWYGSTWGTGGLSIVTDYQTNVTCQVRCHGNEVGSSDGDGTLSWFDAADSTTYNHVCFFCHNMVPSSFQLPATSGTLYQATNAAANYRGPISGFSQGGHGDTRIGTTNDLAHPWFHDSAPGSQVPLGCVACHDESQEHFPVQNTNPYRVSDNALNNNLPNARAVEGPLTNLCTQTDCHPKVLSGSTPGFLAATKHPSDHWPITNPTRVDMSSVATAEILLETGSSTSTPAYDPAGRTDLVGLHIDRYVDHWGYWGAGTTCTNGTNDDEPFLPLDDPLTKQVGDSFNNAAADLITCVTCHNPHGTDLFVSGEDCGSANTLTGIPANRMNRLQYEDDEICMACH
ncbi:MAG: hypothetical protein P1S59_11995 [bacterium]|nr:hypothetical protein [bacterium]